MAQTGRTRTKPAPLATTAAAAAGRGAEFYTRGFVFAVLWTGAAVAAALAGLPALPLRALRSPLYRAYMRQVERAVAALVPVIAAVFLPGCRLVLTGDFDRMRAHHKQIIVANHQIYPDWIFLWLLAWTKNCHADFRAVAMKALADVPIFGTVLYLWEFILVHRSLDRDRSIIEQNLQISKTRDAKLPLWLVIFPEGGLNWSGGVEKSKKYAEKMGISPHPKYVILPKSKGLFLSIKSLGASVKEIFDVTVAYEGLDGVKIPYDTYLVETVFFEAKYPRNVHMHLQRIDVASIPGFTESDATLPDSERHEKFAAWLHALWMAKDERLGMFYKYGELSLEGADEPRIRVPLVPHTYDFMGVGALLAGAYFLWPLYWWLFSAIWWILAKITLAVLWVVGDWFGYERTLFCAIFMIYFIAYLRGDTSGDMVV